MSDLDINNIEDLRNHALRTLEKLEKRQIDAHEAGVAGKLYESVISTLKTELQYASMTETIPQIAFIENQTTVTLNKKAIAKRELEDVPVVEARLGFNPVKDLEKELEGASSVPYRFHSKEVVVD